MPAIRFLTAEEVISIHKDQILCFGGATGIRDAGLLDAAICKPQTTFDRKFLYNDIFEMAAAYFYGIIANHPFVDGNKRTAVVTAMVFLELNNINVDLPVNDFFAISMAAAGGELTREEIASVLRNQASLEHTAKG